MKKLLGIITLFFIQACLSAQDSTSNIRNYKEGVEYIIKTKSDFIYKGYVISETQNDIVVENKLTSEKTTLKKEDIYSFRPVETNNRFPGEEENIHSGNYLLSGSAFLFEENTGSSTGHWLLLENIDYAFNENWAVQLNSLTFYPFSLGVKCAFKIGNNEYLGGNVFAMGDFFADNTESLFFGYGACGKFTKGNSNHNFTLSGGLVGINSNYNTVSTVSFISTPFVSAAYCTRFRRNLALNLEGWYLPGTHIGMGGAGIKFLGNDYLCWTLGVFSMINSNDNVLRINYRTIPIPYFSLSRKFR